MQIQKLDHVNITTARMDRMLEWYEGMLGLKSGPRPDFPFPGAWLYAGDTAVVHLIETSDGPKADAPPTLEHFAFSATGRDAFDARLKEAGEDYQKTALESIGIVQYHLHDPDGNHLHVDFGAAAHG